MEEIKLFFKYDCGYTLSEESDERVKGKNVGCVVTIHI